VAGTGFPEEPHPDIPLRPLTKQILMSAEAYVIIRQNEYMGRFRKAGATDAMKARPLAEMGVKPDRIFRKMEDKAIFLPGRRPDTYYMDVGAAEDFIEGRRRRIFYALLLILAVAVLLFFLGRR
jgi:hypothetical protein